MILDRPLFGVGLDNFRYEYLGRYILDDAWLEPDQSHPHNIVLDFATRLGLVGLAAGAWLFVSFARISLPLPFRVPAEWRAAATGILGGVAYMLAHGSVDHSFFLVDLAFAFYLFLGTSVWLQRKADPIAAP
jgi:O-antigen ligase